MNVDDCSGLSYAVRKDFLISDPAVAPANAAGATTGGFCSTNDTYRTYVAWCNESGCTAVSPASSDFHPASGTTNFITVMVTPGSIPYGATSWAMYYSKASEGHSKIWHCSSTNAYSGSVAASATSGDCKCVAFPFSGQQQSSNQTGLYQTNKLDPDGTIKASAKDGTVQSKLTPEKAILDLTNDLVPRFSPDAGMNYRTVDWNSATVYTVEKNYGATGSSTVGRTVFKKVSDALAAITDSSYTKPYVIKLRSKDGTELDAATINKPYVWIQGDGATRIDQLTVIADGVRVSGVISPAINVGDPQSPGTVSDVDNIWVSNNIITKSSSANGCFITVAVGGGNRVHGVMISNNHLGGSNDPGAFGANNCRLIGRAGDSGTGTVVQFVGNYVENANCQSASEPMVVVGSTSSDATKTTFVSAGNTFNCTIPAGTITSSDFGCIGLASNFGSLWSTGDSCVIARPDSGSNSHHYVLAQTRDNYSAGIQRRVDIINPYFGVNLPATHYSGDTIGYFYIDGPNLTLNVSNPRYSELALGGGWGASDKFFAAIDAWRTPPPSATNTFVSWDNVVQAPDGDFVFLTGAGTGNVTSSPAPRIMKDQFNQGIVLSGANLGTSCAVNEVRYDTGGTKEICVCDPANTWNCAALGAKQD
jgi:hypothetical protein